MNRLLEPMEIIDPINKCYLDYAEWPIASGAHATIMNGFKYYMEANAGIRLTFKAETGKDGRYGFTIKQAELVDEHLYLVWTLKWS